MWPGNCKNIHDVLTHVFVALLEMDCLAFFSVAVLLSYIGEGKHVDSTVKLANNMTLECVYPKTATITQMSWHKEKDNSKEKIAIFRLPYDLFIENRYKTRIHVNNDTANNKSLVFSNADEEDIGFYLCSFHVFPHGIWEKRILVARSGDPEAQVFLGPDIAADSHVSQPRKNVTFVCGHDSDIPMNHVMWEKVQVDHVDFIGQCFDSGQLVYGADYEERVQIDCATHAYCLLVLWNVSAIDSGLYRYSYLEANGENASGWTKLTITSKVPLISVQHIIFIAGAATVLLIISLATIVAFVHHRRKKRKNERNNMMKTFCTTKTQFSHCKRSGCQHKANASGGQNMGKPGEIEDATYVNIGSPRSRQV